MEPDRVFDYADPDSARRAFLDLASAYERAVKADARTRQRKPRRSHP